MSNSVMKGNVESSRRYTYSIGLACVIICILIYGWSFLADIRLDQRIATKQEQLAQVEATIAKIGSEKAFFSYKFAEELITKEWTKRSSHITALIKVLREVQSNNYVGANAIQLSDFTISPTKLSLKWKVSNLILLYYSSPEKWYVSVIDRFAWLSFISNITIKRYNKIWEYYEFTLTADINPHAIIQQPEPIIINTWSITNTTGANQNTGVITSGTNNQ
jgi:hypothetical protein